MLNFIQATFRDQGICCACFRALLDRLLLSISISATGLSVSAHVIPKQGPGLPCSLKQKEEEEEEYSLFDWG